MTDHELIAAVATRLGWKHIPEGGWEWKMPDGTGITEEGLKKHFRFLTVSVDAALGVLDKKETVKMIWQPVDKVWFVTYGFRFGLSNESLPRAILLAFLESHKEKP